MKIYALAWDKQPDAAGLSQIIGTQQAITVTIPYSGPLVFLLSRIV
jgi:hypothetical protein